VPETAVSIAGCPDYGRQEVTAAVVRALDAIGGIKTFIVPKSRVLIKPNLLQGLSPDRCVTTHPEVVKAVASVLSGIGCRVIIADSPGGGIRYNTANLKKIYRAAGYDDIGEETGAELNYDTSYETVKFPEGKLVRSFPVITPAVDADHIIVVSKVKTHLWTLFTGGAKNLFGVIPGPHKPLFHARFQAPDTFASMIVDLNQMLTPSLQIMDGVIGMEGDGPTSGTPRKLGAILASADPFALDTIACRMIGIPAGDVATTREAIVRGLINTNESDISLFGDHMGPFPVSRFRHPSTYQGPKGGIQKDLLLRVLHRLGGAYALYPSFDPSACQSCGECMLICPGKALIMVKGLPHLNKKACLKCYCCHEICPANAIRLEAGLGRRIIARVAGFED
jgi:uncharacterized protein (DUF362 family)/Pyruvate/2-oxoacid:ferredoxin oxidoreductase delta subunit